MIPETEDERTLVDANGVSHFYPIWPDDYLYFGQALTYGYDASRAHQDIPSHINQSGNRLQTDATSNRVYRAPAYYQSKVMDVAHFNPAVNLVAYSKPKSANDTDLKTAYPNMTAIDFASHNDTEYKLGLNGSFFYQPLLDDDGLQSITNRDETNNLLVYAPAEASTEGYANKQTYGVLTGYFTDPAYADSYLGGDYRRVNISAGASSVNGHLVHATLTDGKPTATTDHLLIDKQDFNCPISYKFAEGKRMWYQRMPDLYVSLNKGWESVSLPFTAELVSTQDKGEITHFYSGSITADGSEDGAKIGHEYWLREYIGGSVDPDNDKIFKATLNYPDATGDTKNIANTFLWDYYYSKNGESDNAGPDANADTYQTYYKSPRTPLEQYPLLATATPYIIGFPGKTYYEFDLSGEFVAQNTATPAPAQLAKQAISFVSDAGVTIKVSDDELATKSVTEDGYKFVPNYMSKKVEGFLMNGEGSSFDKTPNGGSSTVPFRPYFIANPGGSAPSHDATRSIHFDSSESSFAFGDDKDPSGDDFNEGELLFAVRKHTVVVTSSLRREAEVRIFGVSGQTIAAFTIQPDETIETPVHSSGVYIIRAAHGRYTKKITVR